MNSWSRFAMVVVLLGVAACSRERERAPAEASAAPAVATSPAALRVEALATPSGAGSAQPGLAVDSQGRALLSWLEPVATGGRALRFSTWEVDHWSEPRTIVQGDDLLANWADTPSMVAAGGSKLAAVWPALQREGSEGYDVRVALSSDGGATWSAPLTPHRDGTESEHDFASLVTGPDGILHVLWLDGRSHVSAEHGEGEQALMSAAIAADGTLGPETTVDARACDCCATAALATNRGLVAAYRDRSDDEIRDIAVVRTDGLAWGTGEVVHADGWKIAGCPVNGPALAGSGDHVALAWFTEPEAGPHVSLALSKDAGASFDPPVRIDDGTPLGRVDVTMLEDGSALVGWLELDGESASFRARIVSAAGPRADSVVIARVDVGRQGGFPRLVRSGDVVLAAWTAREGESTRVMTARLR